MKMTPEFTMALLDACETAYRKNDDVAVDLPVDRPNFDPDEYVSVSRDGIWVRGWLWFDQDDLKARRINRCT